MWPNLLKGTFSCKTFTLNPHLYLFALHPFCIGNHWYLRSIMISLPSGTKWLKGEQLMVSVWSNQFVEKFPILLFWRHIYRQTYDINLIVDEIVASSLLLRNFCGCRRNQRGGSKHPRGWRPFSIASRKWISDDG